MPENQEIMLNVHGMTCTNCAQSVTKVLEKESASDIDVNYTIDEVRFKTSKPNNLNDIKKAIESLGYDVEDEEEAAKGDTSKKFKFDLEKKFIVSLVFTIPLLLSMFLPFEWLQNPYVQLGLCLPVYIIGVMQFGRSSWTALKTKTTNMDVLIFLGSTAAFVYSLTGTIMELGHDYLFYETAATIITLVLLGNILEKRSVKRTTTAIEELSKLQPQKAKLVVEFNIYKTKEVDASQLILGDLIQVNTGDKIPADGVVKWGEATINESIITGESLPIEKKEGDDVISGTFLEKGSLRVLVKATGKKTYLSNVIELVKRAQSEKPEIQRYADKVSSVFVPVIISIAIITFLLAFFAFNLEASKAILNSIAVLAIACPCAMGLATPTAVMVGIGRVTKQGILIKGGKTIEVLSSIKQVVFDKTGTLTTGNFKIKGISCIADESEQKVKSILYTLERHSSHPIAKSITEELKDYPTIPLKKVDEMKGTGMRAFDEEGNKYELGSFQFARNQTLDHKHDLYLFKNSSLIATIDISDEIKPDAKAAIAFLQNKGITTIMLSGDRYHKCAAVAHELGIEKFYAEKRPEEKLSIIKKLNSALPTAMVGDGINDAPALAIADIGISLSNATQIAIDSSQVILLQGNLSNLKQAFGIANKTLETIKQNLFWAFSYNIVAVPIAAFGFLNPMIAAGFMAFSDIVVIGNSLRLKRKKIS